MAISSPPVPSLSPLSALFSQERRKRKIQLKASSDWRLPSNPQPKTKRQNHLRKKLSNTKFSGAFSANQSNQAAAEVPIDERSNTHLLVSHEIDNFGFSKGEIEKEGAKQAASQMHLEESANSQILVSQEVESNQISSDTGECSSTNGMVSKEMHRLEGLVREEEGIDPFGAPTFGLVLRIGALLLAQTLFTVLFFGLGGFLKERREKKKKKREKIAKGEVKETVVMDELEYESKVAEIRAMASLVRQRERRGVEARERGSRDRKKGLDGDDSLNSDSSTDLGKKEPNRAEKIESLQADLGNGKGVNQFDGFSNEHINVSGLD